MLELKRKYKKGRKGRREKKVRYMLEIPGNKMAKLHFMVIRVTSRQFAVRGMPAETIAINKPVPSFLLWFIMIRLIVRLLFMGEPELVSRDFKSFKSLSLSLSLSFRSRGKREFNCSTRHLRTIVDQVWSDACVPSRLSRRSRCWMAASFYDESII